MGLNPAANGGLRLKALDLPDFRDFAVDVTHPGAVDGEATRVLGQYLQGVMRNNMTTFRLFGPDETVSSRFDAVYGASGKTWEGPILDSDEHLLLDVRVKEVLSEHLCEGWLEGYTLSGRHGLLSCYEAFIHVVKRVARPGARPQELPRGLGSGSATADDGRVEGSYW